MPQHLSPKKARASGAGVRELSILSGRISLRRWSCTQTPLRQTLEEAPSASLSSYDEPEILYSSRPKVCFPCPDGSHAQEGVCIRDQVPVRKFAVDGAPPGTHRALICTVGH